tara:strand:+ start:22360 stop:22917 length:558 start_codon:yes stop_codon:yes gene_type:complete
MLNKIYKASVNILLSLIVFLAILEISFILYKSDKIYQMYSDNKVRKIYHQIIVATGQSQDALPLVISSENIENAYNDGTKIVIYKGLIDSTDSWDEVAMVLGHEVAHGTLAHLDMLNEKSTNDDISVLEGNADKMGAYYMMKSGYDICKGRQLYKRWRDNNGDALTQNHPDYSYRYAQLNINCGD